MNREIEKKFLLVEDDKVFFEPSFDSNHYNTIKNVALYMTYGKDNFEKFIKKKTDFREYENIYDVEQHTISKEHAEEFLKQVKYDQEEDIEIEDYRIRRAYSYLRNETYYVFTMKGKGTLSRYETEMIIVESMFNALRRSLIGVVRKIRTLETTWITNKDNHNRLDRQTLEVDFFIDRNLVLAEIELPSENKAEEVVFLGKDVTAIDLYKNKHLSNRSKNNG